MPCPLAHGTVKIYKKQPPDVRSTGRPREGRNMEVFGIIAAVIGVIAAVITIVEFVPRVTATWFKQRKTPSASMILPNPQRAPKPPFRLYEHIVIPTRRMFTDDPPSVRPSPPSREPVERPERPSTQRPWFPSRPTKAPRVPPDTFPSRPFETPPEVPTYTPLEFPPSRPFETPPGIDRSTPYHRFFNEE